jgi:hypothetical protein
MGLGYGEELSRGAEAGLGKELRGYRGPIAL